MLGNLTALTQLDLAGNQLSALPDALGNLTALTQLEPMIMGGPRDGSQRWRLTTEDRSKVSTRR